MLHKSKAYDRNMVEKEAVIKTHQTEFGFLSPQKLW